jgi:hypothetical protein
VRRCYTCIVEFEAFIGAGTSGQQGMMRVFHKLSRKVEVEAHEGVQKVRVTLPRSSSPIATNQDAAAA